MAKLSIKIAILVALVGLSVVLWYHDLPRRIGIIPFTHVIASYDPELSEVLNRYEDSGATHRVYTCDHALEDVKRKYEDLFRLEFEEWRGGIVGSYPIETERFGEPFVVCRNYWVKYNFEDDVILIEGYWKKDGPQGKTVIINLTGPAFFPQG